MVLKRLIVTTLSALGLGALAAGPTSAQEIPAPDLFDGQVACSMNVPTPPMTLGMEVMMKVMSGMAISVDAMGVPRDGTGDGETDDSGLADILYVIDPENSNCGAGAYTQAEFDAATTVNGAGMEGFAVGDPRPVAAGIAADVGAGYSDTLAKFMAKVAADEAVTMAQKAVTDAGDDATDAQKKALTDAQAAQTKADAALYAVGTGPINMAGIAEWRAKGAVEMAIEGWNTAVTMAEAADTALDPTPYNDKYVQVNSEQLLGLVTGETVNLENLLEYVNSQGDNVSTQDAMTGEITGMSAFDVAGKLLIPMELWDHDDDADTDMVLRVNPEDDATYMSVSTRLEAVNDVVEALEKLQSENTNTLMQPAIDVAVARAKVEQAHYQEQFNTMVADDTDLRAPTARLPFVDTNSNGVRDEGEVDNDQFVARFSMKSRYDGLQAAETARDNAGVALETAVTTREAATAAVRTAFTNPQNFYQQLVDRRSFLKDQADAEVTRLAGLTGEDAPSEAMTTAAAKAVTDAQTALEAAETAQASFQDLVAEDSPVKALVEETLKPDAGMGAGDDGGVLVETIDNAFEAAAEAKTTADNAKATADTVAAAVEGLTGDEGAVSSNTAAISENADDITSLDGRVTVNENAIADHDMKLMQKKEYIDNLGAEIGFNPATGEGTGEGGMSRIDTNEAGVAANKASIGENRTMIGTNVDNIAANATAIMAEQTAREEADTMLGGRIDKEVMDRMAADGELMGHITTNAGNIMSNEMSIGANAGNITSNSDAIAANMNSIGSNASAISDNRNMIGELSDDLDVVRAGVAASMALAGMPAINGRGISIGVGSFDGESAFAVGFQIQGEMASFKVGVTSASGATGASAGVGFQF